MHVRIHCHFGLAGVVFARIAYHIDVYCTVIFFDLASSPYLGNCEDCGTSWIINVINIWLSIFGFSYECCMIYSTLLYYTSAVTIVDYGYLKISHNMLTFSWHCLFLTHLPLAPHICVIKRRQTSPVRRQAINWTNTELLSIGHIENKPQSNFDQSINFSFMKMHLKMSSAKWRPFCQGWD